MPARLAQHILRPAIDHWQGQHRWPVTLIVSVVGMTYLYALALRHLPHLPDGIAIACWVIAGGALLVWQIVGTLKAARLSMLAPADVSAVYGGYITALVAVVLVAINMMDGVTRHLPKPAPQALLESTTFKVSIDPAGQAITIDGELNYGSNAALEDLLAQHPDVHRVVLDSQGGRIFAARIVAEQISKRGLDTHVDGRCFSACTIAFMAGTRRTLAPEAQLGFHRYAFASRFAVQTVDADAEQQKDLDYFRDRGVKPDFLKRMFEARHDTIWQPDAATLHRAGVITALPE